MLSEAMVRALEELDKGPAARAARTGMRQVQFRTAARLVADDLATYRPGAEPELSITPKGKQALDAYRAGYGKNPTEAWGPQ